ncbi:MAG: hypothetical protein GY937_13045 [bacterium]|nr:hypothetical protein [bacterium]
MRDTEDVTAESTISVTDPDGYVSELDTRRSGLTFDRVGTYNVHAEMTPFPGGEVVTDDVQVEVTGLRATVSVGPVAPGPVPGLAP